MLRLLEETYKGDILLKETGTLRAQLARILAIIHMELLLAYIIIVEVSNLRSLPLINLKKIGLTLKDQSLHHQRGRFIIQSMINKSACQSVKPFLQKITNLKSFSFRHRQSKMNSMLAQNYLKLVKN